MMAAEQMPDELGMDYLEKDNLEVDYQVAEGVVAPEFSDIHRWARAALADSGKVTELSVRVVDEQEGQALNEKWRGKNAATNVLSFPCSLPEGVPDFMLGDVVLCAPVVEREAAAQGKTEAAHWAHLLVHGILHLLGYDHEQDADARRMEKQEVAILAGLGFSDPYLSQ